MPLSGIDRSPIIRAITDIWFPRAREFENCRSKEITQAATDVRQRLSSAERSGGRLRIEIQIRFHSA